jgi:acetoin utilization deacetylase AcuC-like enzyme
MLTIFDETQFLHHGKGEFIDGQMVPCFEQPERARIILERLRAVGLGAISPPADRGRAPMERIHDPGLVSFVEQAYERWYADGHAGDALPMAWPIRGLRNREPADMNGRLGYWCFDCGTPIGPQTYRSAYASAQTALEAAARLPDEEAIFALCRPPGHHAAADVYGGYCFFNNAAIAAQSVLERGAGRIAILDVDYHHGNGTQSIFEARSDVLFVSLHADPAQDFPYFLGYADERGSGAGEGFTLNYPLPLGTDSQAYLTALDSACAHVHAFGPDVLLVSLGVDIFKGDPISKFTIETPDFLKIGQRIRKLGRPTLFVMEGGYAVQEIGINAVNVLTGFEQA